MFKRMIFITALVLVLAVPAAIADNGQPQSGGAATSSTARPNRDRGRDVLQRLERMRDRLQKVGSAFEQHCTNGKDAARCTAAAKKMLERLQKIDTRLGTVIGKIGDRCSGGATSQALPKACERAKQVAEKLQDLQVHVQQLEQKLQSWLGGHASSGGSTNGASGGPATGAASSDTGLESLDQLSADLAAVQSQTP
jgi:hypothetical protein